MTLRVHIWSDVACPWCYVGQKRLLEAADQLELELEIEWHSFELDPAVKKVDDGRDYVQQLADKYRSSRAQAQQMIDQMARTGAEHGIRFDFSKMIAANTFMAHRLLHLAKSQSLALQSQLKVALFDAHFTHGRDLNDITTLLSTAASVGIDVETASAVLASDDFSEAVRADEAKALELSITGVPFFVIGRRGIGGAQSSEVFKTVIEQALAETVESLALDGEACTPEGC